MNLVKNLDDFIKDFTEYKINMANKLDNLENENNQLKERLTIIEIENSKLKNIIETNLIYNNHNNNNNNSNNREKKDNDNDIGSNSFTSSLKRNRNKNIKEDSLKKNKTGIENINTNQDKSYSCWCNTKNASTSIVGSPPKAI